MPEVDSSDALQAQLDLAGHVTIAPGFYWVGKQLEVRSYTDLRLDDVTLKRMVGTPDGLMMLHLGNIRGTSIRGGIIDGNCAPDGRGWGGVDEKAHCVAVEGGQDLVLEDMEVCNAPTSPLGGSYGDGLYLGSNALDPSDPIKRLTVRGLYSHGNGRHGSQMVSLRDSLFEHCIWEGEGKYGGGEGGAINLESAYTSQGFENVTFRNCRFSLTKYGITSVNHEEGIRRNIVFDDCDFSDNAIDGVTISMGYRESNGHTFKNCRFERNGGGGLNLYQMYGTSIIDCTVRLNKGYGIGFADSSTFLIHRTQIQFNGGNGIGISGLSRSIDGLIADNVILNNGTERVNTNGIFVTSGANEAPALTILNNQIGNAAPSESTVVGVHVEGRGARGVRLVRNVFPGIQDDKKLFEWPAGDNNCVGTTIVIKWGLITV